MLNILNCPNDGRHKSLIISERGYYCPTCKEDVIIINKGLIDYKYKTPKTDANRFIKNHSELQLKSGCFFLITNSNYMLLLARDMEGLVFGIDTIEDILKQVMEDYLSKKNFDDYIKIRSFKLFDCITSS